MSDPEQYPDNHRDKMSPRWDMSQERAFMETLLGQRVNFLLVFFSVVIVGAVNASKAEEDFLQAAILTVGSVVILLLVLSIRRAQNKLDVIFDLLYGDPVHPVTIVNSKTKGGGRRKLVGSVIPVICFLVLAMWALYCWVKLFLAHYCF